MGNQTDRPLCEAYVRIAELCKARNEHPINKYDGCWECRVDEHWWLAVNGHKEKKKVKCPEGFVIEVDPFHCYVTFNGWPAFVMNPYGGSGAAGEAANENTFIAAVLAATAKVKNVP